MGLTTQTTGTMPSASWDAQADRELGDLAASLICRRTFDLGLDVRDAPFPLRADGTRSTLGGSGPLRDGIRQSVVVLGPGRISIRVSGKLAKIVEGLAQQGYVFLGLSPRDRAAIQEAMPGILQRALARHTVAA